MTDVVTNITGASENNGSVVTTCLPTGQFKKDTGRAVDGPDQAVIDTRLSSRFDDPTYYFASQMLTGLVSYYRLDEHGGTRSDVHSGHDLTDNNTVGWVYGADTAQAGVGKVNESAYFVRGNSEYLSAGSAIPALSFGNNDFSVSLWFYLASGSLGSGQHFAGIWDAHGTNTEYRLYWNGAALVFETSDSGGIRNLNSPFSVTHSTWYHMK